MQRRRGIPRVLAFLLLVVGGAVLNVAVALCFWFWGQRPVSGTFESIDYWQNRQATIAEAENWRILAKSDWPSAPDRTLAQSKFGMRYAMMIDSKNGFSVLEVSDAEAAEMRKKRVFYSVTSTGCGWPWASAAVSRAVVTAGFPPTFTSWEDCWSIGRLKIPHPIWRGFAINTVFYAAVLWGLFAVPFALRRRRRIKRGLCPKCAYPVGTSKDCTECGGTLPAPSR